MKYLTRFKDEEEYIQNKLNILSLDHNVTYLNLENKIYYNRNNHDIGILRSNGSIYKYNKWNSDWNSEAVGVYVVTDSISIVISPECDRSIDWGGNELLNDVPCISNTKNPELYMGYLDGEEYTDNIVSSLGDLEYNYAAKYCKDLIFKNGNLGYLPSIHEFIECYKYKYEIDKCMSIINGDPIYDPSLGSQSILWTSIQYDYNTANTFHWDNGTIGFSMKTYKPRECRAFSSFKL